jgi:N6-adenosine-specific RNA methylase IME4/ParB-like chromosome segregation protein Spo0J
MTLPFHPYADLFPLIEGEQFADLVADIKANDVREKIVVWDGRILDGRNRYRAALAAGFLDDDDGPDRAKYFSRFVPAVDGDPLAYVVSKNLKRRHLDDSQRAMVAARLSTMPAHRPAGDKSANLPTSQPEAAKKLSISERALRHARRVQEFGAKELAEAVDRGRLAVSVAERATHMSVEIQRQIAAEAEAGNANVARNIVKKQMRSDRESDLSKRQIAMPTKRYGVIYADPEWRFEVYSRDTGMDRSADNHYPTSATDAICARGAEVEQFTGDDCALFLWATVPMLPDALQVMSAWGFKYKSQCMWRKDRIGTGYWFRNAHEILLVGTRGKIPAPAMGMQWESVIDAPVGEHSAKPEKFYELIEAYFPNLPKIELNARRARAGWDAWGLEAPVESCDAETGEIANAHESPITSHLPSSNEPEVVP